MPIKQEDIGDAKLGAEVPGQPSGLFKPRHYVAEVYGDRMAVTTNTAASTAQDKTMSPEMRAEAKKLSQTLNDLKTSNPEAYLALDVAMRKMQTDGAGNTVTRASGKPIRLDSRIADLVVTRPDLLNKHVDQIIKDPAQLNSILNQVDQEKKNQPAPKVSAAPEPLSVAADTLRSQPEPRSRPAARVFDYGNDTEQPSRTRASSPPTPSSSQATNTAMQILTGAGQDAAASQLSQNAAKVPGITTTISSYVAGNPKAATSMVGQQASDSNLSAMSGAMKMGGMLALMQLLPGFSMMMTGILASVIGNVTKSQNLGVMGAGSVAQNFVESAGLTTDTKVTRIDPGTGMSGGTPSANAPTSAALDQNLISRPVPGMPAPSPSGMA